MSSKTQCARPALLRRTRESRHPHSRLSDVSELWIGKESANEFGKLLQAAQGAIHQRAELIGTGDAGRAELVALEPVPDPLVGIQMR